MPGRRTEPFRLMCEFFYAITPEGMDMPNSHRPPPARAGRAKMPDRRGAFSRLSPSARSKAPCGNPGPSIVSAGDSGRHPSRSIRQLCVATPPWNATYLCGTIRGRRAKETRASNAGFRGQCPGDPAKNPRLVAWPLLERVTRSMTSYPMEAAPPTGTVRSPRAPGRLWPGRGRA